MASNFYHKIAPDYADGPNTTGTRPGYELSLVENDGGVGIMLCLLDSDGRKASDPDDGFRAVFLHVDDAAEFHRAVGEAIDRARPKKADHGWRTRDP